jgi:hypothetical protein
VCVCEREREREEERVRKREERMKNFFIRPFRKGKIFINPTFSDILPKTSTFYYTINLRTKI